MASKKFSGAKPQAPARVPIPGKDNVRHQGVEQVTAAKTTKPVKPVEVFEVVWGGTGPLPGESRTLRSKSSSSLGPAVRTGGNTR